MFGGRKMARVQLKNIQIKYPNGYQAVKKFNLDIEDGEFVVLVGESGSGKSTVLRMIAGMEDIAEGILTIDGEVVNDVETKDRDIAMVFPNYVLYPRLTVYDNLALGLKLRNMPEEQIEIMVNETAQLLDLKNVLRRKPRSLSNTERLRLAIGRAVIRKPKILLMDEPLTDIDSKLRPQMGKELSRIHEKLGLTILYITKNKREAMGLATRIVVMNDGIIEKIDTP